MSIILDALRRGRGRQTPAPHANSAQADAVVQTLGYAKVQPTAPLARLNRLLGAVALGLILASALWAVSRF